MSNIPETAPFTCEQIAALNNVVAPATPNQRAWLAGFLAGLDAAAQPQAATALAPVTREPMTILYASESGNAGGLAFKARKTAKPLGFDAKVIDMADADMNVLSKAKNLLVFAATWGEGDPPERAADFHAALMSDAAPNLEGVNFAVLGLGDTAYVNFCQTAREIDERLSALGANRSADRVDLDLDFAKAANDWTAETLKVMAPEATDPTVPNVVHVDFAHTATTGEEADPVFSPENSLQAEITNIINLNGSGSSQETWHIEFDTSATGFDYEPGDAIGVVPKNDPQVAADLLQAAGIGDDEILRNKLVTSYDITTLSRPLVSAYADLTEREDVRELSTPDTFQAFATERQLIDLITGYPHELTPDQLTGLLRPLPARLYSVASSPKAHEGETHLLVGAVRWASKNRQRGGVASTFLADRTKPGDTVGLYVKPNRRFRLPEDASRPVIMIGAGTGIAPYRGFTAERAETGAKGMNWLFFGERNYSFDFLYQLEWQDHVETGVLNNIDVAFSRDQPEKIYIQHRVWERREELRNWIADGAHIYVCGDEKGMGRDVDDTLVRIFAETANGDIDAGRARLKELSKSGRYQRDVY